MFRRLLLSLSLLTLAVCALAQSGTIKGNVKDAVSGEAIIGANVLVMGTAQGAQADIEGNFEIPKVKAGTYSIVVSFISYKTDTLKNITVYPDQTTVVNHGLLEEGHELNEVVITGDRVTNTNLSVITEIRKSDLVAVGISAQQITMSQDRDAAQIMKRLPGVTIMNNRFVNVRGLSERYSTVMLNGIIAPSTEVDSKAFAFDLIPSNMIDRVLVYKSGSPELPGEFAGADIGVYTKSTVEENSVTLSVSGSFRANTTGKTVSLDAKKYSMDWAGGSGGTRALPSSFPSNLRVNGTQEEVNKATQMLSNTWGTRSLTASPDYRINLDVARTMRLAGKRLDNITSISYSHTNQRTEVTQNYYDVFSETTQKSTVRYHYNDLRFAQTNRLGAISNFTLELDPSNKLEFRNFYNQQGQNQSTFRTGTDNAQFFDVNNMALNYYARSIYSGQLSGKHAFSDAVNFNWILGYNNTNANQPDYRRIRSQRDMGTDEPFSVVIPPGASSFEAGRFYSKLNENTYSGAGNLEIKLNPSEDEEKQTKVTAGYYLEQKDRAFSARWMSYKWANSNDVDNSILLRPFDQIFTPENLVSKFVLEEGTNVGPSLYDRYDGHSTLVAGYAGLVKPFADKFRFSGGLRVEYNVQQIDVYDATSNGRYKKRTVVKNPLTVPMPFANLSYNITEKMLVRIAYSRTVNRPVFRELAPFNFYDFDKVADVLGGPLKTAKIDNIDLRWELYPSNADNISFGVFYKHFQDPIEVYLRPGSNLIYSFGNADKATTYGVEAEVRKSFTDLSSPFLNKLSVVFNGALIKSEVVFPDKIEYENLEKKRAMQGQSPYVVNASVYYNNFENGLQVSIQYNVFGKRLYAVGDKDSNANQYEMPRNQVDFTISKELSQHFELKLGVQDILNQKYRLIQDSNRDKKITGVDESIQTYRWGQYGTLGVVWKL